jgi:hypothetical protein
MLPHAIATDRRPRRTIIFLCYIFYGLFFAIGSSGHLILQEQSPPFPERAVSHEQKPLPDSSRHPILPDFLNALDVLQRDYFAIWEGMWPTAIDWTSAVTGTHLSAALTTLSTSYSSLQSSKDNENLINRYFSQLIGSYFGQDAFALRQEAYDDMLWVVLGWLETIKFIDTHSALHYNSSSSVEEGGWYGIQYIPAFAHRARIFWDMASQGWDTLLCNGGMIWSPYLVPYKNAITNELFIAASISMYLYFPGDENTSPFGLPPHSVDGAQPGKPHDPKYLAAAIEAYKWLKGSNMTDAKGLFIDGFHVSAWSPERPKNSTRKMLCDDRNEMVYTYNQGVLLSGLRGLYEATGARSYLEDGHNLVQHVIRATGWDLWHNTPIELHERLGSGKWYGLGRSGIMEEACDAPGYCSQDGQTFKGIFFHHFTLFCARLPQYLVLPTVQFVEEDFEDDKRWHDASCLQYTAWIRHNAKAALMTRDEEGRFGMWWGAPKDVDIEGFEAEVELPQHAIDYRHLGIPSHWKTPRTHGRNARLEKGVTGSDATVIGWGDLNDRGRGRTVETQGGGVAVLRAAWEITEKR